MFWSRGKTCFQMFSNFLISTTGVLKGVWFFFYWVAHVLENFIMFWTMKIKIIFWIHEKIFIRRNFSLLRIKIFSNIYDIWRPPSTTEIHSNVLVTCNNKIESTSRTGVTDPEFWVMLFSLLKRADKKYCHWKIIIVFNHFTRRNPVFWVFIQLN